MNKVKISRNHNLVKRTGFLDSKKEKERLSNKKRINNSDNIVYCTTGDESGQLAYEAIQDKREQLYITKSDKVTILCGTGSQYNKEYCDNNGYYIMNMPAIIPGGVIISNIGDYSFAIIDDLKRGLWLSGVRASIVSYLKSKNLNARIAGNDILIDDLKISGSGFSLSEQMRFEGLSISVVDSSEIIKNVCVKSMIKLPTNLQKYGLDIQDLVKVVIDYTAKYLNEGKHTLSFNN